MARKTRNPHIQIFDGYTYWRNPRGYYQRNKGRTPILLHRVMWERRHGPIPPGYDVHHVDENPANNADDNFELKEHGLHAKEHWQNAKERIFVCSWCGCSFASRNRAVRRFCSLKCHMRWRRDAGVDDEQRACVICGKPFWVRRDIPTKTCSRSCGRALGAQTLRQRKSP